MVSSIETETETTSSNKQTLDPNIISTPRISFSSDFLDDDRNFISITPNTSSSSSSLERSSMSSIHDHNDRIFTKLSVQDEIRDDQKLTAIMNKKKNIHHNTTTTTTPEIMTTFEFLSSHNSFTSQTTMLTADQLFFEGKLLPFCQMHHHHHHHHPVTTTTTTPQLGRINIGKHEQQQQLQSSTSLENHPPADHNTTTAKEQQPTTTQPPKSYRSLEEPRIWYIDDDPSPRPPKCTVLWKELLRLKKNRPQPPTSLSPSSSSSSTSSSGSSISDQSSNDDTTTNTATMSTREKHMRRIKKGLERTRSAASIRIRPMVNVPICTTGKCTTTTTTTTTIGGGGSGGSSFPPPLFPRGKGCRRAAGQAGI